MAALGNFLARQFKQCGRFSHPASCNFFSVVTVALSLFFVAGCDSRPKRPYGYHNLGMVRDLLKPETYIPEHRLLVRFDGKGFSVMSTACTYDLSALERQTRDGETVWESHTTDSLYSNEGKVLHGPSNQDLPYYELKIDSSEYGQGVKALYAFVGKQKEPSWRLVVE